jgi:hypothetical protein
MDERFLRGIRGVAGAGALLLITVGCESWFGPLEGEPNPIRGASIEVRAPYYCAAQAMIDKTHTVYIYPRGRHVFSNLAEGTYEVRTRVAGGGDWFSGSPWGGWAFCRVYVAQGEHVSLLAGKMCY